ncbi:hypothetical protein AK812_SmicGene41340 [Symbiodinium microadriaticum]|uniref:Uncharacterized protein n=1 Tax=Symbiodinium microadriaticum TaxID=2951 RepID=A0A1Q9C6D9_SYMMI|nr:hypothetical protein AK812_SmicGene41340 [Symbiodinium microadriaticum]
MFLAGEHTELLFCLICANAADGKAGDCLCRLDRLLFVQLGAFSSSLLTGAVPESDRPGVYGYVELILLDLGRHMRDDYVGTSLLYEL